MVDSEKNHAEVRLIDLASFRPLSECEDAVAGERDPGMILGVKNVISMLSLIKLD